MELQILGHFLRRPRLHSPASVLWIERRPMKPSPPLSALKDNCGDIAAYLRVTAPVSDCLDVKVGFPRPGCRWIARCHARLGKHRLCPTRARGVDFVNYLLIAIMS